MATVKQLFVNLPVKDLDKSVSFFTKIGFTFNPQFTDENATCMVVSETIQVMLLTEKFFSTFSDKKISNAKAETEVICALSVDSRDEVNDLVAKAIEAGGREYKQLQDQGWMYTRCFEDLDGHQWEVFFMDMAAMPQG